MKMPLQFTAENKNRHVDLYISEQDILKIVKKLAQQISRDYQRKPVTLVCILNGALPFFSDLLRRIRIDGLTIDTLAIRSYQGTETTGSVQLVKDLSCSVKNRHVVLVEDIVDTGTSAKYLQKFMQNKGALSVEFCTLLDKPSRRLVPVRLRYIGRSIEDTFVVGYGLDYNQHFRELPFIGAVRFS